MDGGQPNLNGAAASACSRERRHPDPAGLRLRLWAAEAATGLGQRRPRRSARSGLSRQQAVLMQLASIAVALALTGLVPGLQQAGVAAGVLFFTTLTVLRLLACSLPPRWAEQRILPAAVLPRASVMIALYRESAVLPQLVMALDAIDYPPDRLELRLVLEADDSETLATALALDLDARFSIIRVPPGTPRTKPRALNYALRFCSGDIIAIHDAEDRPHPRQLRTAAESFAAAGPDLACLQAPLNWYNRAECWLTRQFALEYAAHFQVMLPLYARLGWPLPLGGTSNYFRAAALRRAGGWDAWNVTEDADLGFRLHALGYHSGVIAPPTLEEAPARLQAWICQRTRWIKGHAQTVAVHSRPGSADGHPLALFATLGTGLVSALLHLPVTLAYLAGLAMAPASESLIFGGFWLGGYAAAVLSAACGMRRAGLTARLTDLLTMPAYWPLQTVAAVRALYQLVTRPYFWDKTEHGLSTITDDACTSPSPPP